MQNTKYDEIYHRGKITNKKVKNQWKHWSKIFRKKKPHTQYSKRANINTTKKTNQCKCLLIFLIKLLQQIISPNPNVHTINIITTILLQPIFSHQQSTHSISTTQLQWLVSYHYSFQHNFIYKI